ncbi:NAD(P)H-dependent oxidoreductase [Ruminococcus sp. OA3]|uniref:NAD(P)H-dependent oxidoreductase n=1 Tax=Ruminococcus sp. OA3 TaxID=2914164 RepID=UPI001F062148|nr:NAD(P)H-dependent oxidoreductase [Ruminococcus sp. OA3]MCH1983287.1 NAD(P)H-dependent oxidoreductase [Ruminococcus sp. OA3]
MKISLINGSPKTKGSASGVILKELQELLSPKDHIVNLHFTKHRPDEGDVDLLQDCDAIVFAFPLYVDALPSHLVSCLIQLENSFKNTAFPHNCTVYAIVNCGFYEGRQNVLALDIMKCWCEKAGVVWGGGLGIGGGGMMPVLGNIAPGKGPKKNFSHALETLSDRISRRESGKNICFSPNFPRFLYKIAAEIGWRQAVKNNGLKTHDLWNRQI